MPEQQSHSHRARAARAAALVFAVGLTIHLPWLSTCFSSHEFPAGAYCGPFVRNFERFGLVGTRGLPLGDVVLDSIEHGIPYLSHPPGLIWLLFLAGGEEWQLRLPTAIAGALAGTLLCLLLARRASVTAAAAAGVVLAAAPAVSLYAQVSYEPVMLALGLAMALSIDRLRDGSPRPALDRGVLAAAAFAGPWIDWRFLACCAMLVPLAWRGGPVPTARRLALPAASSALALVLILVWRRWVEWAPDLPPVPTSHGLAALIDATILTRPPLASLLAGAASCLEQGFTLPVLALALCGLVRLARRFPRLSLAFAVLALHDPLLFPGIAASHTMFWAAAAPLVATACAALIDGLAPRPVRLALVIALGAVPLAERLRVVAATRTDFMRELGTVLTAAAGGSERPYLVAQGFGPVFGYYVASPRVILPPTRDATVLARGVADLEPGIGARYLWLRMHSPDVENAEIAALVAEPTRLAGFLAPLPKRRLSQLERRLAVDGRGIEIEIDEAWLVTLREPE